MYVFEKKDYLSQQEKNIPRVDFSETQINIFLNRKKEVKLWSHEDIRKAFIICYLSKRFYIHIKHKMHIPQPCLTAVATKLCLHKQCYY